MATRADIFNIVTKMKNLPNSPINGAGKETIDSVMEMFFVTLKDLPTETLQAAALQYMGEGTFFPTPGVLREKAMELSFIAQGIPTPAEAWGMVLEAERYSPSQFCETGAQLREKLSDSANYWRNIRDYSDHVDNCNHCRGGGYKEAYGHSVVAETVRMLGGRDNIFTDNPTADRARFLEAYKDILAREKRKAGMTPEVRGYIEAERRAIFDRGEDQSVFERGEIKQLADGMRK